MSPITELITLNFQLFQMFLIDTEKCFQSQAFGTLGFVILMCFCVIGLISLSQISPNTAA